MKNVILLTIDALRQDVLGCYGHQGNLTPFLDQFASQSIRFTRSYSVAPYTQASFPGILTSSYIFDYPASDRLSGKRILISECLKKSGVATAAFHSNPYLSDYFGWNRGWDMFYDSIKEEVTKYSPFATGNMINQRVEQWLSARKTQSDERPFFIWAHYMDVHEPYIPSEHSLAQVAPDIHLSPDEMLQLFIDVVRPRDTRDLAKVDILRRLYCCRVREVDEHVRNLFTILDQFKLMKDTTIILTSDHGDEFGEHGGLSHDGKMYGELVQVPLIIYQPDHPVGNVMELPVSGIDISPTILYLFGLPPDPSYQGEAILPADSNSPKGCYGEAVGKLTHRAKPTDMPAYYYVWRDHKIIYRVEEDRWELFDLTSDPHEKLNIIHSSPLGEMLKDGLKPRINRQIL